VLRERRARGVRRHRVAAERDGHVEAVAHAAPVGSAVLVDLPVHEGRARVDLLHPVHADVARPGARVLRDHGGQRDERRRISGPAVLDRQQVEVRLEDDVLDRAAPNRLRHRVGEALQLPEALDLLDDALRRLHLEHIAELLADRVQGGLAEGHRHPPLRPELVGEKRMLGALEIVEEESRAAGLDRPVDDLGHLEIGVDLGLDLDQLAGSAKLVDPGAEVSRGHDLSLSG
jgi:hypothetical protein